MRKLIIWTGREIMKSGSKQCKNFYWVPIPWGVGNHCKDFVMNCLYNKLYVKCTERKKNSKIAQNLFVIKSTDLKTTFPKIPWKWMFKHVVQLDILSKIKIKNFPTFLSLHLIFFSKIPSTQTMKVSGLIFNSVNKPWKIGLSFIRKQSYRGLIQFINEGANYSLNWKFSYYSLTQNFGAI